MWHVRLHHVGRSWSAVSMLLDFCHTIPKWQTCGLGIAGRAQRAGSGSKVQAATKWHTQCPAQLASMYYFQEKSLCRVQDAPHMQRL